MYGFLWYFRKINLIYFIKKLVLTQKFLGVGEGTPLPPKIFFTKNVSFYYVIKNTYFRSKNFRGRVGTPWEPPPPKNFFTENFRFRVHDQKYMF